MRDLMTPTEREALVQAIRESYEDDARRFGMTLEQALAIRQRQVAGLPARPRAPLCTNKAQGPAVILEFPARDSNTKQISIHQEPPEAA